jgi:ankyrin repeat protein
MHTVYQVQLLVDHKTDVAVTNSDGSTPLCVAVQNQQREVVEFLLQKTAAAKAEGKVPSKSGWGVVHIAVALNDRPMTALLLEAGLSINERMTHGETPLQIALANQNADMVQYLLKNKASCNMDDGHGTYPLHMAAKLKNRAFTDMLIKYEADIYARDGNAATALHQAAR